MVKKWCFYWVNHDHVVGSEQSGIRPALVISNDMVNEILPVVTVIPVSSIEKESRVYPTEVFLSTDVSGLQKPSVIMLHQIRTVSVRRLGNKCGEITDDMTRSKIADALRDYFEI